ncbi:MAG: hypothetical protein JWO31_4297 [Phycisphaerales bacterium]|nr:hypothetical protein [Phycisphaerales bacterium]
MPHELTELRYATGELAHRGDRVDNDGWKSVVDEVIATPEQTALWGLGEPGLMLKCKEAGLVFEPRSSMAWDAIVLEGREA